GTSLGDRIEDIEQVASRACQPVEPRHHQHVAVLKPADRLGQLWPVGLCARSLLLEDVATASRLQLGNLAGKVLVARTHPRITENSHFFLPLLKATFE